MKMKNAFKLFTSMTIICIFSIFLYCHDVQNLQGPWILDDKGTVSMNPIVMGKAPFEHVWTKDFWGIHDVIDDQSHKSWRPLCTISYIWNRKFSSIMHQEEVESNETYWFHVVDRVLHGLVSALIFPVTCYTLLLLRNETNDSLYHWWYPFINAILFSVHPIHVEAVANTTGRAEVLCALFYFIAFLVYARVGVGMPCFRGVFSTDEDVNPSISIVGSFIGVLFMLIITLASMLCKEYGVTLPLMCIVWDAFIATNTSIPELISFLFNKKGQVRERKQCIKANSRRMQCMLFLFRSVLCFIGCAILSIWRLSKNGHSKPNLICEQNPSACEPNRLLRFMHYSYLWGFNFWLMLYPNWLSPDWSGESIPLMNKNWATDPRVSVVLLTYFIIGAFIVHSVMAAFTPVKRGAVISANYDLQRRTILTCSYWMIIPFVMSSNLLVHVGFVVADRTLYLPSFGFCLLLMKTVIHLPSLFFHQSFANKKMSGGSKMIVSLILTAIILMYTMKQQVQTKRWSHPVLIWEEAYKLNPDSVISGTEYGMALVNSNRNKDAIEVLTHVHNNELTGNYFVKKIGIKQNDNLPEVTSTSNLLRTRFKLVTAMGNLGNCKSAMMLIDEGLEWIDQITTILESVIIENDIKNRDLSSLLNANLDNKAYFLVARSRCSKTVIDMAAAAYQAAVTRPQMEYVIKHAESVSKIVEQIQASSLDPRRVLTFWELESESSQAAKLTFKIQQ